MDEPREQLARRLTVVTPRTARLRPVPNFLCPARFARRCPSGLFSSSSPIRIHAGRLHEDWLPSESARTTPLPNWNTPLARFPSITTFDAPHTIAAKSTPRPKRTPEFEASQELAREDLEHACEALAAHPKAEPQRRLIEAAIATTQPDYVLPEVCALCGQAVPREDLASN